MIRVSAEVTYIADLTQGGVFTHEQMLEAQKDPLLEAKLAVRRWDDQAKVPDLQTLPLEYYERMATKSLLSKMPSTVRSLEV